MSPDRWAASLLFPLAAWILLSGLDDLFILLVHLATCKRLFPWPRDAQLESAPERRIAMLVPLWREHGVIGPMLDRNLSAIAYRNYDVFVGVYPNDRLTQRAVAEASGRHARVHMAMCPRDGPTSKGDCLNSIFASMLDYERRHGVRFEIVVTHDAEDLAHRDSLRLINWFSRDHEMVQVPVLPLATGWREFTHGLYCDEFAEFQSKDIPARQRLGGFLPGNGVGTGLVRAALERLPGAAVGRPFDPQCLTEDYETGYLLFTMGCRQIFVPLRFDSAGPIATREFFPRRLGAAVRQRSRWVAGIALQGWERHGWRAPWPQVYWFWRDRKGLLGNLLSPAANLVFFFGILEWFHSLVRRQAWHFPVPVPLPVSLAIGSIALAQAAARLQASARIYGPRFAWAVPFRMVWGNLVNWLATADALRQFFAARVRRHTLVWRKTEHAYPAHHARERGRPRLGEILVGLDRVSTGGLQEALFTRPKGLRLGEHLLKLQRITEQDLYHALSVQSGIPCGLPAASEVDRLATRILPAATARRWKVLPYRVELGQLHVVSSEVPSPRMLHDLQGFSTLEVRFRLVSPAEFEVFAARYLPRARPDH